MMRGIKDPRSLVFLEEYPGCEHTRLTWDPETNGRIVFLVVKWVKIGLLGFSPLENPNSFADT